MSHSIHTSESSNYAYSAHYSTSSTKGQSPHIDGTANKRAPGVAGREFEIDGISTPSAFILEVFLNSVNCIPASAFQNDPSNEGGRGGTLDVRKGVFENQVVALKRIRPDRFTSKDYKRSLADVFFELRALSHKPFANHRNIPSFLGFSLEPADRDNDTGSPDAITMRPVLLVEWATTDLNRYFLASQEQSPMHCAELVADIADGLQAMHIYGLSHADLKPENVLLYPDGSSSSGLVAKLSDFGFSGSEQHEMPDGGDTPLWGAPGREYAISNTECPGDVFSFGLVAMFAALKGHWDFSLYGKGVEDVEQRQANLRDALHDRFLKKQHDVSAATSAEIWFSRWEQLLSRTVTPKAESRLSTSALGCVRQSLTGQDPFTDQKRAFTDQVQPFRGSKGAKTERFPFLMWTRMGTLSSDSTTRRKHGSNIRGMLPADIKQAINDDIKSLDLATLSVLKMRDAISERVVAILFLRSLMAAESGPSSRLATLNNTLVTGILWYQIYKSGTKFGIDAREKRPHVFRLADLEMTEEAILELKQNPAFVRHTHRGFTVAHHACMLGNPKLLSAILELDSASIELMNHFGVTPLMCALGSECRDGSECLRVLLDSNANAEHVASNGLTVLEQAYMNLLENYYQLPMKRAVFMAYLGFFGLKDRIVAYLLGGANHREWLKETLSEEQFEKDSSIIEKMLGRQRHLGNALYDTLYERLETLRQHLGPCDSMHSIYPGLFTVACLVESLFHQIYMLLCATILFCVLASWFKEFTSGTWWEFFCGVRIIIEYISTIFGVMRAMARGTDPGWAQRCTSMGGIMTIDLVTRDDGLLSLLPVCLYVSWRRFDKSWSRVLTELEWMRASFEIPGSVYDPSGFDMANMRKHHPISNTLSAFWSQYSGKTKTHEINSGGRDF